MALVKCPECGKQVSDKACVCPHCGIALVKRGASADEMLYDFVQEALDMPDEKREHMARLSCTIVAGYLDKVYGTKKGADILIKLISTCLGADGRLDNSEYEFIISVLGIDLTYDALFSLVKQNFSKIDYVDAIIDSAPEKIKYSFVLLSLYIFACNGIVTGDEKALLVKYMV